MFEDDYKPGFVSLIFTRNECYINKIQLAFVDKKSSMNTIRTIKITTKIK